ncbi:hypothetical protein GA0115256_104214, partial [Streptomyces sp. DconLS]
MHEHRKRHEDPTATGSRPRHSTARAAEAQRPVPAGAPRPDAVAALQRLIGNAAVGELLGRAGAERSEGPTAVRRGARGAALP